MKTRNILFALLIASASHAFADDPVKIEWKPKVGSIMKYRLTTTANVAGQDAEFSAVLTNKVIEIKADGNVVTTATTGDLSLKVAGQDMSSFLGDMSTSAKIVMSPIGEIVSRELTKSADNDNPRLETAFAFVYPQEPLLVGGTWKRVYKGDKKMGTVNAETSYTYRGIEKLTEALTAHKVEFTFKETEGDPMTGSGVMWVDVRDGALLKGEFTLKNVELGEGMPKSDIKGSVKRIAVEGV